MPDEPDPPRKFYGFKPREFATANPPHPAAPPPASAPRPDPGIVRVHDARIDVHDLHRAAATGQPLLSAPPSPTRENDVHTILRANLAVADAAGLNQVTIDPRHRTPHQRRVRRCWILLVAVNVPLGTLAWKTSHPMTHASAYFFTFAVAGMALFTARLVWETFFLNTD
jgi:hypothetical protein